MAEKQVSVRIKAEGAGQLKAEFQSIGSEAQKSFGAIDRGARAGGQGLQNVGFQVQDFAVQVAGGTDASRALAQQLPQLLSGFGLLGVALGTATAVAVPLFLAFGVGADKVKELDESVKSLSSAMGDLRSATNATQVDPAKLFGDFGAGAAQAREVLEIQRQIAAARAETALAQTSNSLTSVFGDFKDAIAIGDDAVTATNRLYALADVADALGLEFEGSEAQIRAVAAALQEVAGAEGAQAQADAMANLRGAILEAADAGGVLSEEALVLLQNLTDAELAALGLASVDIASPIAAGANEAARLAQNLALATAASRNYGRIQNAGESGPDAARRSVLSLNAPGVITGTLASGAGGVRVAASGSGVGAGAGGGGGGGVNEADREAKRIYDQTRTSAEKYAIELAKLNSLHQSGKLDTDTYNRALEKLGKDLNKTEGLGKKAASAIRGAFDNLFDDPAQALKNLSKQLFQMALYAQLAKSMPKIFGSGGFLPLMNANGNAFEGGRVQAFATGGIVSGATMFPMKGGMGVMGEAGPEAIMPLTRIGGKLGVAAAGGGGAGVKVEINNYSGESVNSTEGRGPNGERIIRVAVGKDLASGAHDAALRSRFGTRPNPVKR
jgi:hypothetical protein